MPDERLRLTCTGTTLAADQPPPGSPVIANGLIDFTARRVHGFGLGSQPILVLTASEIDFGSTPPERARGVIIEGSINRQSGDVRILVHTSQQPAEILIEFRLDCEFEQPIS